ncbi:MAG: hypothetical protein JNJ70_03660 [Verrucomicrobiales bacterium]|nr:hypothetical protein [Verrucomicrobiales bacterium]
MKHEDLDELIALLRRRLDVIGDAALRENDPDRQLALLREISEGITAFHQRHRGAIPPRLNHFLENASLQKALEWAEAERAKG